MDQDFTRIVVVTLIAGLVIVGAGTTMLFFVFRAVSEGRRSERRYLGLAMTLVAFVFICCAVFFALALR